jgi:DNA-binding transcriptional LysR family regulator
LRQWWKARPNRDDAVRDWLSHQASLGRLEIVLPDWKVLPELGVYAIYPHRRFLAPKVKVFLEALRTKYGDGGRDPWWVEAASKRRARAAKLR